MCSYIFSLFILVNLSREKKLSSYFNLENKVPSQLKPVSLLHGPGPVEIIFTPWVKFKLCKLPWAEIKGFYLSSSGGLRRNGLGGLKIKFY